MANTLLTPEVNVTLPTVEFDFDQYLNAVTEYIDKYNLVVTNETLADAKKAATELNKLSDQIAKGFREHEKKIEKPAKDLGGYRKTLVEKIQEGRAGILEQIQKLDAVNLEKIRSLMNEFVAECRETYEVSSEFATGTVEQHVKLTAGNGDYTKLSKAGRDLIENMVKDEATLQQKVELRLSVLKVASNDAGLSSPIERRHVESFLYDSNEQFDNKLNAIINAEVEREQAVKERQAREQEAQAKREEEQRKREAEAQAKREAELAEREARITEQEVQQQEVQQRAEPAPQPEESGTKVVRVHAYFDVKVPSHVPDRAVLTKVASKLQDAGINPTKIFV